MSSQVSVVAEVQGQFGPVSVSELLLQKLWLRRAFVADGIRTVDGRPLRVIDPGRWNRSGGPDFREARLEIGGRPVNGDVEIHFYPRDWVQHGHHRDPHYAGVALHVILFAEGLSEPVETSEGNAVPTLHLLPLLRRDLEELAMEEALLLLEGRDHLESLAPLLEISIQARRQRFREAALERWRHKCAVAAAWLREAGWEEACHRGCLEVLGYRPNREPMRRIAEKVSLQRMRTDRSASVDSWLALEAGTWVRQGLRPANQPRQRLIQYRRIVAEAPDWPARWERLVADFPATPPRALEWTTRMFRRETDLPASMRRVRDDVLGGALGGSRLATLLADALLPLAAAAAPESNLAAWWWHAPPGDWPDRMRDFLRLAEVVDGRSWPSSNGSCQGALQILAEEGGRLPSTEAERPGIR